MVVQSVCVCGGVGGGSGGGMGVCIFNSLWVEVVLELVCFCLECPVSFSRGEWGEKGVSSYTIDFPLESASASVTEGG